jgi:capsular exopolysaccharide synthesis family protein
MSRVFEALQKSQGENPSASPLVSGRPDTAAGEATAVAVAAGVPIGTPTDANCLKVPAERVLHPSPSPEQRLVALADPNSQGAEMFRVLATRLAHMQAKRRLQKLLITSSVGDEGKSVVAVNLALTLARRHNARTLLIEADLRRPGASALLTDSPLRGISDWDAGELALEDSLYQVNDLPLWFLSAGQGIQEPLPLLESDRFAKMLDTISSSFDWVLLDSTPMLPMADSTSLSRLCDGVLVVVREGFTRRKVLDKALESIETPKLLGVVFNQASMLNIDYDRYYGGNNSSGKSKKENKKEPSKESDKVTAATA